MEQTTNLSPDSLLSAISALRAVLKGIEDNGGCIDDDAVWGLYMMCVSSFLMVARL